MARSSLVRLAIFAALCILGLLQPAPAAVTSSGEVVPFDPITWTTSTKPLIGWEGQGIVAVDSGDTIESSYAWLGDQATADGRVTISGAGSAWTNSSYLRIGNFGSGTLSITNGGSVSNTWSDIGYKAGSRGEVTVSGIGSRWINNGNLYVGYEGSVTLTIAAGGFVKSFQSTIGTAPNATAEVTVTGTGSIWDTTNGDDEALLVGDQGSGTLTITNGGAVIDTDCRVGDGAGSTGRVTVSGAGSTWTVSRVFSVGRSGSGTVAITDGGAVIGKSISIGRYAGSAGEVTVSGAGSTWTNSGDFYVGFDGNGSLAITDGGAVSNDFGEIARELGSTGRATVSGAGSTWTNGSYFQVGGRGDAALAIAGGGSVSNGGFGYIGCGYGSTGVVVVSGAGSTWISNDLHVGNAGSGSLAITDGGSVTTPDVSITGPSLLAIEVNHGSRLTVDGGSGTIDNDGTVRLIAGAAGAAGAVYTPILADTWIGLGTYEALGGTWDATGHVFAASAVVQSGSGMPLEFDLAMIQRVRVDDVGTGWSVSTSFLTPDTSTMLNFTVTAADGAVLGDLKNHLDAGESVLGAWQFLAAGGYTLGDPAYLSFDVGPGPSWDDLQAWHYDGVDWEQYDGWDLAYDGTYASFTVTSFGGYAVTAIPPIPGDATGDGVVDEEDAATLAAHWGQSGGWSDGDLNGDGVVNAADAAILAAHWGHGTSEAGTVPEPGSVAMLVGITVMSLLYRRWRQA